MFTSIAKKKTLV